MKKFLGILMISIAGFTYSASAQHKHTEESAATPPAVKGQVYGEDIAERKVVSASELEKNLKGEVPVRMQLKGTITAVCQARGCWATVDVGEGKEVFVKMKDYGFFLPTDASGKEVLLSGDAFVETHTVEALREKAKKQNKSQEEINAITEDEHQLRFTAYGITVLN